MKDRDLDRTLEKWAEYESRRAPEMRPTPALYEAVRGLRRAPRSSPLLRRWLPLSAAAAALLILAVIYPVLFGPSEGPPVWSGRDLDLVGLREIPLEARGAPREKQALPEGEAVPKKSAPREESVLQEKVALLDKGELREKGPPPDKGRPQEEATLPKRGLESEVISLERLEFQFKPGGSPAVFSVDARRPMDESPDLTSADAYRLLIVPAADLHAYVFQLSPYGAMLMLFPNETYGPGRNPLGGGSTYHLPPAPGWFHPGPHKGTERMYVLVSSAPLTELERLYAAYRQTPDPRRSRSPLSDLLSLVEHIASGENGETAGWVFEFRNR